jgi:hypothetical protein
MTDQARKIAPHAEAQLAIELDRLDFVIRKATQTANSGEASLETRLKALDRIVAAGARRSKLLGLDAPEKVAPVTPDGQKPYAAGPTDEERAAKILELLGKVQPHPEG